MTTVFDERETALVPVPRAVLSAAPDGTKWWLTAFVAATVAVLFSPLSHFLTVGFPLMSAIVANQVFRRNPARYVGLVCWLWFLTPLVRRLVDYRSGSIPAEAVLLAPLVALLVPAVRLLGSWRTQIQVQPASLIWIAVICVYATMLGLLNFKPAFVIQDLLTWVGPLSFAFVVYQLREQASALFQSFERAFVYGTLVISIYGLVQFFWLPRWDVLWMRKADLTSIGIPEPTKLRVFSAMNSPQILASFLVVGILIAISSKATVRFLSIPLGLLCLILTQSRSGWVAMVAGLLYLAAKLPNRRRVQLAVGLILSAGVFMIALQNPDLQDVVMKRFDTFSDVRGDVSYMDRVSGYKAVLEGFKENPFGLGMGATPAVAQDPTGAAGYVHGGVGLTLGDSTYVTVLTTMGLAGTILLFLTAGPLAVRIFSAKTMEVNYANTLRAVLAALLGESALDAIVSGPTGFLAWSSVGFLLAFAISKKQIFSTGDESNLQRAFTL